MITWFFINALGFVGTPAGLLDGWIAYAKLAEKRNLRPRLSLAALALAVFSVVLLGAYLFIPVAPTTALRSRWVLRFGIYAAIAGGAISFSARPRLIPPALAANVGSIMLWFGLTQP